MERVASEPLLSTPASPSKVYAFVRKAPTENDTGPCTADLAASRAVVFTYADGTRLALGVDLPASCTNFYEKGRESRDLTGAAYDYFGDLVDDEVERYEDWAEAA